MDKGLNRCSKIEYYCLFMLQFTPTKPQLGFNVSLGKICAVRRHLFKVERTFLPCFFRALCAAAAAAADALCNARYSLTLPQSQQQQ